eukprot:TRINITY_DN1158_c1_g1_i4.p2 TRINITY_DN1158_c1_g1~~TRINITY_DN1158_c1_g1_i4.p2  ORF type:complete len:132 (+),score=1.23 TRINITY_DN1158_c1_g1_i4:181-576(+)
MELPMLLSKQARGETHVLLLEGCPLCLWPEPGQLVTGETSGDTKLQPVFGFNGNKQIVALRPDMPPRLLPWVRGGASYLGTSSGKRRDALMGQTALLSWACTCPQCGTRTFPRAWSSPRLCGSRHVVVALT